jgi:type I restriction enzyme M protein
MLQNNAQLKSLIDKLWQNFWEGGISNPSTAIEQITYLIFMKRLDDLESKR